MGTKRVRFKDVLAKLILAGEKTVTWRIFDDKNLSEGDALELVNADTGAVFAHGRITEVKEKLMRELDSSDFDGHEQFANEEEMYTTYRGYYGDSVGPDTSVKIIRFVLQKR